MDQVRLNEKITYLYVIVNDLKEIISIDKDDILNNKLYINTVENNLRKVVEIILDISNYFVSKYRLRSM